LGTWRHQSTAQAQFQPVLQILISKLDRMPNFRRPTMERGTNFATARWAASTMHDGYVAWL